jgi:hypothetical protein
MDKDQKISNSQKCVNRIVDKSQTEEWRLLGCYAVWLL